MPEQSPHATELNASIHHMGWMPISQQYTCTNEIGIQFKTISVHHTTMEYELVNLQAQISNKRKGGNHYNIL